MPAWTAVAGRYYTDNFLVSQMTMRIDICRELTSGYKALLGPSLLRSAASSPAVADKRSSSAEPFGLASTYSFTVYLISALYPLIVSLNRDPNWNEQLTRSSRHPRLLRQPPVRRIVRQQHRFRQHCRWLPTHGRVCEGDMGIIPRCGGTDAPVVPVVGRFVGVADDGRLPVEVKV
jgi:hypothetical protein